MISLRRDLPLTTSSVDQYERAPTAQDRRFIGIGTFRIRRQHDETTNPSLLSVVIPAKNESLNLVPLIHETTSVLRPFTQPGRSTLEGFEIIVVDDASTDPTQLVLQALMTVCPELKVIRLALGSGQSAATMAGIRAARGNWIATLDADLQNDPRDITRLWKALSGHDAALGWRVKRQDNWSRRLVSYWANLMRNRVLGQSIRDTGCSVRIFSRAAALRLPTFNGMHRFFGPLLLREGCDIVQVPVLHRPRAHGYSHYSFGSRLFRVVFDLLGVLWLIYRPLDYRVIPPPSAESPAQPREPKELTLSSC